MRHVVSEKAIETWIPEDVKEKENSEFKPVKHRLKIDLVSYPARARGGGKYGNNWFETPSCPSSVWML